MTTGFMVRLGKLVDIDPPMFESSTATWGMGGAMLAHKEAL